MLVFIQCSCVMLGSTLRSAIPHEENELLFAYHLQKTDDRGPHSAARFVAVRHSGCLSHHVINTCFLAPWLKLEFSKADRAIADCAARAPLGSWS